MFFSFDNFETSIKKVSKTSMSRSLFRPKEITSSSPLISGKTFTNSIQQLEKVSASNPKTYRMSSNVLEVSKYTNLITKADTLTNWFSKKSVHSNKDKIKTTSYQKELEKILFR